MTHHNEFKMLRKPNKLGLGFKFYDYETKVTLYCNELIWNGLWFVAGLVAYNLLFI